MLRIYPGQSGINQTWQSRFDMRVSVLHLDRNGTTKFCRGYSRLAFVMYEEPVAGVSVKGLPQSQDPDGMSEDFICDMHENELSKGGPFWPHDCIAVAVYFCETCAAAVTLWNQA